MLIRGQNNCFTVGEDSRKWQRFFWLQLVAIPCTIAVFDSLSSHAKIPILIRVFPLLPLHLAPSPVGEVSIPQGQVTSYSIEVRWLPPEKRNGEIGYYLFYWESSAGSSTNKSFALPGSVHYKIVSGLKPFTNYTFSVVPYNLRKNLSGQPFIREGQTSATGMKGTPYTRKIDYSASKNPSSSSKSKKLTVIQLF